MADDQALQGPVGGGPKLLRLINPTDLPQRHQHPGGSEKPLDHQESTQIRGLVCPHQDLGLKLQPRFGECLQKLFTSI